MYLLLILLFFLTHPLESHSRKDRLIAKAEDSPFTRRVKEDNPPSWMLDRIEKDLEYFRAGITPDMMKEMTLFAGDFIAHYQIKDNRVFLINSPDKSLSFRTDAITQALKLLCRSVPMPDVEFFVALGDAADGTDFPVPVFAFAKNVRSDRCVLIPDFEVLLGHHRLLEDVKEGINAFPWRLKAPLAVWRGATTGGNFTVSNFLSFPRSAAIAISLQNPQLVDARFTSLVQCKEQEQVKAHFGNFFGSSLSIKDQLKYKYQLLIDGNTCAYSRAYWQLFSNCSTLKQETANIQWYYDAIKPYVHYIPIKEDLSDLSEKLEWAKAHDLEVQTMVRNAQDFARQNLEQSDVYYYLYLALREYANLF